MEKFRTGDYVKTNMGSQGIIVDPKISPNGWWVRVDFYGEIQDVPLRTLQYSSKEEWEYVKKMRERGD